MHVANDPQEPQAGPFADLLRLQSQFQMRMTEETMRYLRAVQAALAPVAPTSVIAAAPGETLRASGAPGERVELSLEVENTQAAHVTATAALTAMVEQGGTTWFPTAEPDPPLLLVAPGQTAELVVTVALPAELAPGEYRGAMLLQGFRHDGLPVVVTVREGGGGNAGDDGEKRAAGPVGAEPAAGERPGGKAGKGPAAEDAGAPAPDSAVEPRKPHAT